MTRRIVAGSSGFAVDDGTVRLGPVVREAIALSRRPRRAHFCFLGTADGDDPEWEQAAREALVDEGVEFSAIRLTGPVDLPEVRRHLGRQDVIWANGGSGAELLRAWHRLDLDDVFRDAWESGTVMAGISAGAICWHVGGTPDWAEPREPAILGGLGLVPYGTGVHYQDGRRPILHGLVASGVLPASYATDDGVALVYEDTDLVEAIAERRGAYAYFVVREPNGTVAETVIAPRLLEIP